VSKASGGFAIRLINDKKQPDFGYKWLAGVVYLHLGI